MVRILPVIDVMGGQVVRAVGGRRDEYRPVRSALTQSTDPATVARALLERSGSNEMYVADLDAIRGASGLSPAVEALHRAVGCRIWLDHGMRRSADVSNLLPWLHTHPVVASETVPGPSLVREVCSVFGSNRVAFSIDLSKGKLLGSWRAWGLEHPRDVAGLASRAADQGVGTVIVLDLAAVGTGDGPATLDHVRTIRAAMPRVAILTGGGIRGWDDVARLEEAGADGVLISSALHDGILTAPSA